MKTVMIADKRVFALNERRFAKIISYLPWNYLLLGQNEMFILRAFVCHFQFNATGQLLTLFQTRPGFNVSAVKVLNNVRNFDDVSHSDNFLRPLTLYLTTNF